MKITIRELRQVIREVLSESQVGLFETGTEWSHAFLLFDVEKLKATNSIEESLLGGITISKHYSGWTVNSVSAHHGYGVILYKLALDFSGEEGLRRNAGGNTSDAALAVWKRFENDPSVKKRYDNDLGASFMVRKGNDVHKFLANKIKLTPDQAWEAISLVRNLWTETYDQTPGVKSLGDDMPRIVSYGKSLGDDDGTGESGEEADINEALGSSKKPTTYLGSSKFDDDDPENSDEDFPAKPTSLKQEIFEPGYQEFPRFMNAGTDDFDTPSKKGEEEEAWNTCVELFDTVKNNWNIQTMSNPTFIDYALKELKEEGISDGVITRMRFRLENQNAG